MKLIIEVVSDQATERSGRTKDGRDWRIIEQEAYLHVEGKPFPVEMKLQLRDDQAPFKVGKYEVLPSSIRVSRFGEIEFQRYLDLVPVEEGRRKAS